MLCSICYKSTNQPITIKDGYLCRNCFSKIPYAFNFDTDEITSNQVIACHKIFESTEEMLPTQQFGKLAFNKNLRCFSLKTDKQILRFSIEDVADIYFTCNDLKKFLINTYCNIHVHIRFVFPNKDLVYPVKKIVLCPKGKDKKPQNPAILNKYNKIIRKILESNQKKEFVFDYSEIKKGSDFAKACSLFMIRDDTDINKHNLTSTASRLKGIYPEKWQIYLIDRYLNALLKRLDELNTLSMILNDTIKNEEDGDGEYIFQHPVKVITIHNQERSDTYDYDTPRQN